VALLILLLQQKSSNRTSASFKSGAKLISHNVGECREAGEGCIMSFITCTLHYILLGVEIKEEEMDGEWEWE
jgi:hypothetical protein